MMMVATVNHDTDGGVNHNFDGGENYNYDYNLILANYIRILIVFCFMTIMIVLQSIIMIMGAADDYGYIIIIGRLGRTSCVHNLDMAKFNDHCHRI